jgi:hypothetical protein
MYSQAIEKIEQLVNEQESLLAATEARYSELQEIIDEMIDNDEDYLGSEEDLEQDQLDTKSAEIVDLIDRANEALETLKKLSECNDVLRMIDILNGDDYLDSLNY